MKQEEFVYDSSDGLWFTSDTHWCHQKIIEFCNRPFSSVEEMNEKLIENWNSVVKPTDTVFHLGDFCFGGSQAWNSILDRLNGNILLIKGNHDEKNLKQGFMIKFKWVGYQLYLQIEGRSVYLNHFPFLCYGGMHRDFDNSVFALSGHTHLSPYSISGKDISRMQSMMSWNQYDVGIDANNFKPVSFKEITEKIKYYHDNNTNQAFQLIKQ